MKLCRVIQWTLHPYPIIPSPSPSYPILHYPPLPFSPFFAALSISISSGADSASRASSYTSLESFPFLNFLNACSSAAMSSHSPWNFLYLKVDNDDNGGDYDNYSDDYGDDSDDGDGNYYYTVMVMMIMIIVMHFSITIVVALS